MNNQSKHLFTLVRIAKENCGVVILKKKLKSSKLRINSSIFSSLFNTKKWRLFVPIHLFSSTANDRQKALITWLLQLSYGTLVCEVSENSFLGSISVRLVCFTILDLIKHEDILKVNKTTSSKQVKQEVSCRVILPLTK